MVMFYSAERNMNRIKFIVRETVNTLPKGLNFEHFSFELDEAINKRLVGVDEEVILSIFYSEFIDKQYYYTNYYKG